MNFVGLSDWIICSLCGKSTKKYDSHICSEIQIYNNAMEKKYISGIYSPINTQWNKGHKSPDINGKIDIILAERYS